MKIVELKPSASLSAIIGRDLTEAFRHGKRQGQQEELEYLIEAIKKCDALPYMPAIVRELEDRLNIVVDGGT